ncbi:substrate-binding domain-containing protein [Candidatus Latescibacterota bacterium]
MRNSYQITAVITLFIMFIGCSGPGTQKENLTIAVIPMGTTHEFWKSIHAGAVTAAHEEGEIDIIWKGPLKEDDRDEQIQIVETMVARSVDAVVLSPMDDRALIRPVREAASRGIPTVLVNSVLQGDYHVSFVATDNYKGGVLGAEHIGNLLRGKGNLILIRVNEGDATVTQREEGFLNTIKTKYPGIEILSDNQYAGVTTETAFRTTENLLNRFGEMDALFTPNESSTFGCLRALQDRDLAGSVIFVGFDSTKKLIEAMERKEIHGLVIQNPFKMGYYGVKIAVSCLNEEPYEKLINTGVTLATPENMNDPEIKKLLSPDLSILSE